MFGPFKKKTLHQHIDALYDSEMGTAGFPYDEEAIAALAAKTDVDVRKDGMTPLGKLAELTLSNDKGSINASMITETLLQHGANPFLPMKGHSGPSILERMFSETGKGQSFFLMHVHVLVDGVMNSDAQRERTDALGNNLLHIACQFCERHLNQISTMAPEQTAWMKKAALSPNHVGVLPIDLLWQSAAKGTFNRGANAIMTFWCMHRTLLEACDDPQIADAHVQRILPLAREARAGGLEFIWDEGRALSAQMDAQMISEGTTQPRGSGGGMRL